MARRSIKRKTELSKHGGTEAAAVALLERNLTALPRSMTFARMVQDNLAFRAALKDLRWLFPPLCHRKDQAVMTETERSRYLCAFSMLNSDGTLGQLVDTYAGMHMQHTNAWLLPWHRIFLYLFEQ